MRQNVRRTHFVPIVHGVQLVNRSGLAVPDVQPVGMGVEMVDVQSILFQKGCCQFRCIVLRLFINRIVRRGHNTLNGNGSAISITTAISGVPAAQAVGQILPCTYIIHIVMDTPSFMLLLTVALVYCSAGVVPLATVIQSVL